MGEFFKGWRRKIGVLTLVMACVFMGGWVRSSVMIDCLTVSKGWWFGTEYFMSSNGLCAWYTSIATDFPAIQWRSAYHDDPEYQTTQIPRTKWSWIDYGMSLGDVIDENDYASRLKIWVAPYWSIVVPLTLISAYLLLSKPRKPC